MLSSALDTAVDTVVLLIRMEYFNAESMQIEHDLVTNGQEYGPCGILVQVDTPWAAGFVNAQGVPLV